MAVDPTQATPPTTPPAQNAPTIPVAAPWYAGMEPELVGVLQTRGWHEKTPAEAAAAAVKSYRELELYRGAPADRLLKLPADTDSDGWKAVWQRLGTPEKPEGYDLSGVILPDGKPIDQGFADFLRTQAHANNLPASAAQGIAGAFARYVSELGAPAEAEAKARGEAEQAKLRANWGANYDANLIVARNFAERSGIKPEALAAMEKGMGFADLHEWFRAMGQKMGGEDKFVSAGGPNNGPMSREQAIAEKRSRMSDKAWVAKYMAGDTEARRFMSNLNHMISGVTPEMVAGDKY